MADDHPLGPLSDLAIAIRPLAWSEAATNRIYITARPAKDQFRGLVAAAARACGQNSGAGESAPSIQPA